MKTWFPLLAVLGALASSACGPTSTEPAAEEALGQSSAKLITCTNDCAAYGGTPISCTGNACSGTANYVVCDGVYTYCQQTCASPQVLCPNGTRLKCTGTTSCGLGSTRCSVQCDGVEKACPNVLPGRECKNDGQG